MKNSKIVQAQIVKVQGRNRLLKMEPLGRFRTVTSFFGKLENAKAAKV